MTAACAALLLLAPIALTATAAGGGEYSLRLCTAPPAGRAAFVEVRLGRLRAGEEVVLTSREGRPLGALAPYGIRSGAPAGTYSVPVPPAAFAGRSLTVQVRISRPGAAPRVPSRTEVERVRLVFGPKLPSPPPE